MYAAILVLHFSYLVLYLYLQRIREVVWCNIGTDSSFSVIRMWVVQTLAFLKGTVP